MIAKKTYGVVGVVDVFFKENLDRFCSGMNEFGRYDQLLGRILFEPSTA